jgi:hypothetical protein
MPWLSLVDVLYPAEKKLSSYFYAVAFPCGCVVSCREETTFLFGKPRHRNKNLVSSLQDTTQLQRKATA